jgi:hypothetical protein
MDDHDDQEKTQDSPPSSVDRKDDSVHTAVHDETIYVSGNRTRHSTVLYLPFQQVEYEPEDPRDPINFSRAKKWTITVVASFSTLLTCASLSRGSYTQTKKKKIYSSNCSFYCIIICPGLSLIDAGSRYQPIRSNSRIQHVCPGVWCSTTSYRFLL